jgi:hypothetical protein
MAALLEPINKLAESPAQDSAGTGTAEAAAELVKQAANATLPGSSRRTLSEPAKHFGDFFPVLVARDREQP